VPEESSSEPAKVIKAINGVLELNYFRSSQKTYEISNQTERSKILYVEYPIQNGWQLSENSPKPDYTTQKYYRFRVELGPMEDKKLTVSVRQPLIQSYQLTSLNKEQLDLFVAEKYIDEATRAKLEKLLALRMQIAQIDQTLNSFNLELAKI